MYVSDISYRSPLAPHRVRFAPQNRPMSGAICNYRKDFRNREETEKFSRLYHLDTFRNTPEDEINSSGYVLDSLEAAVWCLITTDTYADCVLKAVNLGLDTDTTAAIAGGLAGLYYGRDSIPEEWLHTIREGKTLPQNLVEI